MLIEPGTEVSGRFVPTGVQPGCVWRWQVDDDDAVYSGTAPTEQEAWRQAHAAVDRASPVMVARAEGVTAGIDAMRARAEAAETRASQAEADARLMLTMLVDLDVSEGTNVVRHWQDLGLTDAERDVLWSRFARTPPGVEEWEIEAVRRIIARAPW